METIFSRSQLKQVSLTPGDSTSKLGIKHNEFLVKGNLIGDFSARWSHKVHKNDTISLLNLELQVRSHSCFSPCIRDTSAMIRVSQYFSFGENSN